MRKIAVALLFTAACSKAAPIATPVYQALPVERRDIVVSARASGSVQPDTTVEVKSQASGEVLQVRVQTGQVVKAGDLLVRIDPRIPKNNVDQAQSNLEVAQARLLNATTQRDRSEALFKSQSITQTEYDQAVLDYATARAGVVSAQVNLQNAQITLDQTEVRAPSAGTIIEMDIERGQVISSPTSTVGGGTVLLKMADLNLVQVSTLVDETDIGKIQPGLRTSVTVDAYPNTPFDGHVLKIEPLATTSQNVTMFPVLVRIENRGGLLRPGMNSDVEIHVGRRDSVVAVPNSALRTTRDVSSAAEVLGLSMEEVTAQLAQSTPGHDSVKVQTVAAGNTMTLPTGQTVTLPDGVTEEQVKAIMQKRMSGGEPNAAERALLRKVFAGMGGGGGGRPGGARPGGTSGGGSRYIVFVRKGGQTFARNITTGLTDLDYSEVLSGLEEGDSVLILPSASLVQAQKAVDEQIQAMGANVLTLYPGQMFSHGVASGQRVGLTVDDAAALQHNARLLSGVVPEISSNQQIKYGSTNANTTITGATPNFPVVKRFTMAYGRFFTAGEDQARERYAVVGSEIPEMLGANPAGLIHQTIQIRGISFEVIGVMAPKGAAGSWSNPDEQVVIPLQTARFRVFGSDRLRQITIEVRDGVPLQQGMVDIEQVMRREHKIRPGAENDFMIRNSQDILATQQATTEIFTTLLASIAAVSLVVGGIGIMNIMLVSVTERTKEIGVRKALGATRLNIMFQFLVEALVLCLAGGALGIGLGVWVTDALAKANGWNTLISTQSIAVAFGTSAAIGIVFGLWPASRAAALNPIQALRYE